MSEPSTFLRACRGEPVPRTPVWFMRQAGRALPEYRKAKGDLGILEVLQDPALTAEITLQPVQRLGVDAAILYSDIIVPAHFAGFGIEIAPGVGPVCEQPFGTAADLDRLRPIDPAEAMPWQGEAVRILVRESPVPVIGFAGAPFTVASYLIEGRPSRDQTRTRAFLHQDPDLFGRLLDRLADLALASLLAQVEAGVGAVMVFDSWAGALSHQAYDRHVAPALRKILDGLAPTGVPRIVFGVGTGEILGLFAGAGADVVGVDWRMPLSVAATRVGEGVALQGNLDPTACLASWPTAEREVGNVLAEAALTRKGGHGHVFNLGHGVLPETDPGVLAAIVDLVHDSTCE